MNSEAPTYIHVKVTINSNELYSCGFAEKEVVIGRGSDCQILLENAGVSRNHAKLLRDGDSLRVVDLHSGNGTFVNGRQVEQAEVAAGDTLRIGKFTLYVKLSDQPLDALQPSTSGASEALNGTVFLRPEERVKILQQSKVAPKRERVSAPLRKAKLDGQAAAVFFAAGVVLGFALGWLLRG